jgi:hypothetical protein
MGNMKTHEQLHLGIKSFVCEVSSRNIGGRLWEIIHAIGQLEISPIKGTF